LPELEAADHVTASHLNSRLQYFGLEACLPLNSVSRTNNSTAGKPKEANAGVRADTTDDILSSHDAHTRPTVTKTKGTGAVAFEEERQRLEQQLTIEESQLEEAERARNANRLRISELKARLAELSISEPPNATAAALPDGQLTQTFSTEQKLIIFRQLFRGREDVYPVRWQSKRTGASGYMPECSNKFDRRVCDIEQVRCQACAHRMYRTVTDHAILTHLKWSACHGGLSALAR
jgi:hypothetical protein